MGGWLSIIVLLATPSAKQVRKVPASRAAVEAPAPQAANFSVSVTPATVTFAAADPDSPLVAGSAATTVYWTVSGTLLRTWNLGLSSAASTFTNCPTVPVSAVTVTCTSASGGGGLSSASCSGSTPLSTSLTQVASGTQGYGSRNYSVTLTYTLTDQWKYIARTSPPCTLSITYNAVVN
jgi:hypothetical protein